MFTHPCHPRIECGALSTFGRRERSEFSQNNFVPSNFRRSCAVAVRHRPSLPRPPSLRSHCSLFLNLLIVGIPRGTICDRCRARARARAQGGRAQGARARAAPRSGSSSASSALPPSDLSVPASVILSESDVRLAGVGFVERLDYIVMLLYKF